MHINEDHFIAEIIDPDTGEVLPEGTQGELVFTSITKQAFPLLRYRTRDICILRHEDCPCGRTHIKMCKPMGRSDDMLIVKGVNVFPSQIETVLLEQGYQIPGAKQKIALLYGKDAYFTAVLSKAAALRDTYNVTVLPQGKKLGKQLGQLEAAGFAGAAFMDKDEVKVFAAQ